MTQNLRNVQAGQKIWFLIKKTTCSEHNDNARSANFIFE